MTRAFFINSTIIELAPGTDGVIALTFQVNDIADLKDVQANYSNTFKAPANPKNMAVIEQAGLISSATKKPYRNLPAKVIQNGIEVVNGYAVITRVEGGMVEFTVYSGNVQFFQQIDGLKLSDLDLTAYNFLWHFFFISQNLTNTEGTTWPIVDNNTDSKLIKDFAITGDTGKGFYIQFQNMLPAFYIKTLMNIIFKNAGVNLAGAIFSDPTYLNLLLQCSGELKYTPVQIDKWSVDNAVMDSDLSLPFNNMGSGPIINQLVNIPFKGQNVTYQNATISFTSIPGVTYDISGQWFSIPYTVKLNINATIKFSSQFSVSGQAFYLIDATTGAHYDIQSVTNATYTTTGQFTLNLAATIDYTANHKIGIFLFNGNLTNSGNGFSSILADIIVYKGDSQMTITLDEVVQYNDSLGEPEILPVTPQSIFNDMSQTDFIKSICNIFALIPNYNYVTNTMSFIQFKELYANKPLAKDWTGKVDKSQPELLEYTLPNYAQNNYCRYKQDDTVDPQPRYIKSNSEPLNYGDAAFTIDNETLPLNADLITLPYSATRAINYQSGSLANIRLYTDGTLNGSTLGQRILLSTPTSTDNISIRLVGDISNSNLTNPFYYFQTTGSIIAYFSDPTKDFSLDFDSLFKKQYGNLITQMLNDCKVYTPYLWLTELDISGLNQFIPVYMKEHGQYFYVNKISNWQQGKSSQVQLIRL